MIIRRRYLLAMAALGTLATQASAQADTKRFSGQLCTQVDNQLTSGENDTFRDSNGISSVATELRTVFCPAGGSVTPNLTFVNGGRVFYHDSNSTDGLNGSLFCEAVAVDRDGDVFQSALRHSCATAGGCDSPSSSFTTASHEVTFLAPPALGLVSKVASSGYLCFLPGLQGLSASSISNYRVATSEL